MTYKISIGKQIFFGNCFLEKLVYDPIPKKVINNLYKDSINVFLTHVQVYDRYDVIANFQYGSFPCPLDEIADNDLIDNDKIVNYSYSERDLADMLNVVGKNYNEFSKERIILIILLLLTEKMNNQQLCIYHYIGEINRVVLTILLNNTSLLFTKIVLYFPEENSLNNFTNLINFTEKVQDEENKSKEIIIHSRNDFIKKEKKADINLCISEKELIDAFLLNLPYYMKNQIISNHISQSINNSATKQ